MQPSDILGVVLAGGGSRRMGADKALLPFDGWTLTERAAALLGREMGEVVVSGPRTAPMKRLGLPLVEDRFTGLGPLAGLHAGLDFAGGRAVFALACDLPFVSRELVRHVLVAAARRPRGLRRARAWVAVDAAGVQPLCGLYSAPCLEVAAGRLAAGEPSMSGFLEVVNVVRVPLGPELPFYHRWLLLNVNRPGDYSRARAAATRVGSS